MSYDSTTEFDVLHALKIRGMSTAEPIAETTGHDVDVVLEVLADAVEQGRARARTGGRVQGHMLTGDGRDRHSTLRAKTITPEQVAALEPAYDAFLGPNRAFKTVTTRWQLEADGDVQHVLPELEAVHAELLAVLDTASGALPRMGQYPARFDQALARFAAGSGEALAKPMSGSYHDVWMELHEDLLLTLGRERDEADE